MCDGPWTVHSPSSQVRPPLLFSPADVVCTQQLAKFKESPAMEKLCDDNDIRVVTSYLGKVVLLVGHTRSSSRTYYGGTS